MTSLSEERKKLLARKLREKGLARDEGGPGGYQEAIPRRAAAGPVPASSAQRRLWLLDRLEPGSAFYNIAALGEVRGALRPEVLAAALGGLAARHESLRTTFREGADGPLQIVAPPPPAGSWPLPRIDLSALPGAPLALAAPADRRGAERDRLALAEALRPFDLAAGPLLRTLLLRLAPEEHALVVTLHHVISDGWSHGVFLAEMMALYEALGAGRPSPLPPLPVQYPDFALWQQEELAGPRIAAELAFWKERLGGSPPALDLPTDRPRPPVESHRGARFPLRFSPAATAALAERARESRATLFMALLAAWAAVLHRLTGQGDLAVGSPVANRRRREVEGLIGFFVNTLVLRLHPHGRATLGDLLDHARDRAQEAFAHQDVPFEKLVEELQPVRDLARSPSSRSSSCCRTRPAPSSRSPGCRSARCRSTRGSPSST